jgi:hypothetical protein
MLVVIGIAVIVVALAVLVWMIAVRGPRQEPGIVGFRKHIDALSPESRREVQDRVRERQDRDDDRGVNPDDGRT